MAERTSHRVYGGLALSALALTLGVSAVLGSSSCLSRRESSRDNREEGCTACHGDPARGGEPLTRAAPPRDLSGATSSSYPGVGAHALHLSASTTHAAVRCDECHVVPDRTDARGHADDAAPAELAFGALASSHDHVPSYDPVARRCNDTYCHGDARAVWTEPRSSKAACGSCHGLPPPTPHPQSTRCFTCHGDVVDEEGRVRAPELHVNGKVELRAAGCVQCHGGGEDPAPPLDTTGNSAVTAVGVGAHRAHLSGGSWSRPLACTECHDVPSAADDFAHADGLPAELTLRGIAQTGEREPQWIRSTGTCADTWCHGPEKKGSHSPRWTRTEPLGCTSCHGAPPPAPHPQMATCSSCHSDVGQDNITIVDRERHVNGVVDVEVDQACTSCHGSANAAPPRNVDGQSAPSARGVGAHQTHVLGTEISRPVPCAECHAVPTEVLSPGHVDTFPPAEVAFSGTARAFGARPQLRNGACVDSACHGAVFPDGHESGGTLTAPLWSKTDGSQAACGTCHALPPPRPHPYFAEDCGRCHKDLSPDGKSFLHPALHVDGVVTFELPD